MKILVRGTNWLGDAVMTTPALLRLREKFPAAHIALLCPEKLRGLWLNHPAVRRNHFVRARRRRFRHRQKIADGQV
jgi:heptosyltransferase-2